MSARSLVRPILLAAAHASSCPSRTVLSAGSIRGVLPSGSSGRQSCCSTRANFSSTSSLDKAKRSLASNPTPDTPGEVPVMRTRGKSGSSSKAKGGRGKHADEVETTTTNDELPGERFSSADTKETIDRTLQRCRDTVARMVGGHGRADPAMLDKIRVTVPSEEPRAANSDPSGAPVSRQETGESYNIKEVATIGIRDGALVVTCFDPNTLKYVERAIYAADMGLSPQRIADGDDEILRIPVPRATAETRAQLSKEVSKVCENARGSIRETRHRARKLIANDAKRKVISDDEKDAEQKNLDSMIKAQTAEIDKLQDSTQKRLDRGD